MVYDHLSQHALYRSLHPRFAKAFDYLLNLKGDEPCEKVEIEGSEIVAIVQEYETRPAEAKRWEAHRKYIDIQYIISGEERAGISIAEGLAVTEPYREEKDAEFYSGPDGQWNLLREGMFAIYFPHDVHKPSCFIDSPRKVKKVVVKVAV